MSLKIMAQVWEHPKLENPTEKLVLLSLADFANDEGECWPKIPTVARKCSITEGACSKVIDRLAKRDFLSVVRGRGRGNSNRFHLHVVRGKAAEKRVEIEVESEEDRTPEDDLKPVGEKGFEKTPLEENPLEKRVFSTVKPPPEKGFLSEAYKEEPSVLKPPIEPSERDAGENSSETVQQNSRAPFHQGTEDRRFTSPHFLAVCKVCQAGPDGISWKLKTKIAFVAVTFQELGYSPDQIELAGTLWPRPIAPTPEQLQDTIKALLNQKDVNANGTHHKRPAPANSYDASQQRGEQQLAQLDSLAERRRELEQRKRAAGIGPGNSARPGA